MSGVNRCLCHRLFWKIIQLNIISLLFILFLVTYFILDPKEHGCSHQTWIFGVSRHLPVAVGTWKGTDDLAGLCPRGRWAWRGRHCGQDYICVMKTYLEWGWLQVRDLSCQEGLGHFWHYKCSFCLEWLCCRRLRCTHLAAGCAQSSGLAVKSLPRFKSLI